MTDILEKKHAILVTEFDRYVIEHPEFAAKIPPNAQVVLQVEGDDEYNEWSRQLAKRQREQAPTRNLCEGEGPETGQIKTH